MGKVLVVLALAALLAPASAQAGAFSAPVAPRVDGTQLPPGFTESTAFSIPGYATAVRFAPDGRVFVADKDGIVYVFDGPGDDTPTVFADLTREVFAAWDRGLLGLAIDPQYASGRPYVYVAYTYDKAPGDPTVPRWSDVCASLDDGCTVGGRVSRLGPDGSETVLLDGFCDQSASHSMGALAFGPDGALYVSAGDGASYDSADYGQWGNPANPCGDPPGHAGTALTTPGSHGGALRAQSFRRPESEPATLNGALLRVDPDSGDAPASNPAAGRDDPQRRRIVAYGFRNPFRFAFRPGTGEIWVGDVGFASWEEIDRVPDVSTVRNYGWPCEEGNVRQDAYEALGLASCQDLYSEGSALRPYYTYSHKEQVTPGDPCPEGTSSISGMAFYGASAFPARYRGALFLADYSRSCIWAMLPGAGGLPDPTQIETFAGDASGPVDLQVGPDGALYYADVFEGEIRRIATTDGAPTARISADQLTGPPRTVRFDASTSSDTDGGALTYAWDLDGDGDYDDSVDARPAYTYTRNGYVTVRLRVTDAGGSSGTASQRLTVGTPPAVSIDAPAPDTHWAVGDRIEYAGSSAPGTSLRWTLDMRHCARSDPDSCHTHRIGDFSGPSGSFVAPDHEYPSHLELSVTATDPDGLSTTKTLRLDPRTVALTVDSTPPGARIGFGSEAAVTPFTREVIANSLTPLSAASPQTVAGSTYVFGAWGDGGAQTRLVRAPSCGSAAYSATYAAVPDVRLAGTEAVSALGSVSWPGSGEVYRLAPASSSGTVMALRLRLDAESTASKMILGLYSDANGEAGVLLGSGTLENPVANAWNEVRLDGPVGIVSGRRYWFALLNPAGSAGPLRYHDRAEQPYDLERTSASLTLTALPSSWQVRAKYSDGGPISGAAYGLVTHDGPGAAAMPSAAAAPAGTAAITPCATPTPTHTATPPPAATAAPPPPVFSSPPPRTQARVARLHAPHSLRMNRHGVVRIRVKCPRACRVTATLSRGHHRLGLAKAKARAGHTATLRVHLSKRGRALVRHRKRLTLRVTRRSGGKTQAARRTLRVRR